MSLLLLLNQTQDLFSSDSAKKPSITEAASSSTSFEDSVTLLTRVEAHLTSTSSVCHDLIQYPVIMVSTLAVAGEGVANHFATSSIEVESSKQRLSMTLMTRCRAALQARLHTHDDQQMNLLAPLRHQRMSLQAQLHAMEVSTSVMMTNVILKYYILLFLMEKG